MGCGVKLSRDLVGGGVPRAKSYLVVWKAAECAWKRKGQMKTRAVG